MRIHLWLALTLGISATAVGATFSTALAVGAFDPHLTAAAAQDQVPEVLTRSRALYPTLTSYTDTGTVTVESPGVLDTAKFKTYFRQPTDFYFEFYDHTSISGGVKIPMPSRMVLWMFKGELETWNAALKSHSIFPRAEGRQVSALVGNAAGTYGTAVLISSLLFAKANISAAVQELVQATVTGEELVGGRRCHKVQGIAQSVYPSGAVTNVRPMTIWIDAESLLIRKVFEDTPKGYPVGSFSRRTTTYEPQANLPLDDARFAFKVPAS
jgi:hypothetical protein